MGVGRSQREEAVVKIGLCCQKRGGMAILGRVFAFGKQAVRMKYQVVGDHLPRHLLVRLPNRLVFGTMGRMGVTVRLAARPCGTDILLDLERAPNCMVDGI